MSMIRYIVFLCFLAALVACSNSDSYSSDTSEPLEISFIDSVEVKDSTNAADSSQAFADTIKNDSITEEPPKTIKGMVRLNGASVTIGTNDKSFKPNERPAMKVVLSYDFYIGVHEVTCGDYSKVAKESKLKIFGNCNNDSIPLTDVTYYDAILYANAKSKLEGYDTAYTYSKAVFDSEGHCTYLEGFSFHADADAFRLPTEAEWIYAATRDWNIKKSWNHSNSGYKLHDVCSKEADSAGFCDMAGNAMEWVNDWMGTFRDTTVTNYIGAPDGGDKGERVVKGGCYTSSEIELSPYNRGDVYTVTSSTRAEYVGFRLAFGNIPNAHWIGDDGISQTSVVTPLAGSETVKGITGSYNMKLAFRNDVSKNIAYIDYQSGSLSVKEITKGIDAYHPDISPNGNWIAFCTGSEGVSGKSTIYVQSLDEKASTPIKLDAEKAAIPRWRVLETGDTAIVYVTDAGNNKEDAAFMSTSTWQVPFNGGKFGIPQKFFDGAYHGGISENNTLAITGARLLRARMDGRDTVWYDGEQACNTSLAMDRSKRTAFLDFGGKPGRDFVGSSYSTHQRIFIADSTGKLEQSILAPAGYTFDHTEWTTDNTKTNIVATLTNINGAHTKIVLVNPLDSSITELAEGEELWHPNLWVKKKAVKQSSSSSSSENTITSSSENLSSSSSEPIIPPEPQFELDLDSAGMYYNTSGEHITALEWRYTLEILWQYKDTANVVILGSSRADNGINPLLFSTPFFAINLAVPASTIGGDYVLLTNYVLPHVKKAKVIMTTLDIDRWNSADSNIFESSYKYYLGHVYDRNHNYWKDGYPEGLAEATYDSPGDSKFAQITRPTRGFYGKQANGWNNPTFSNDSAWFNSHSREYNKNFNTLVSIIKACQEKDIVFIGIITPQNPRYKETGAFGKWGLLRSQAPGLIKQIDDLSLQYPNFILMDENNMGDHDYTDEMALDKDHLSADGAVHLTTRIDSLIKTLNIDFAE